MFEGRLLEKILILSVFFSAFFYTKGAKNMSKFRLQSVVFVLTAFLLGCNEWWIIE